MARPKTDPETRFWRHVSIGDCWEWTSARSPAGYGRFGHETGRSTLAHRWIYQRLVGLIPEGLDLDHLCRNRACVNPDHLEPVTRAENLRRGGAVGRYRKLWTHCPEGHPLDEENTVVLPDGRRRCRSCRRRCDREAKRRRREALAGVA